MTRSDPAVVYLTWDGPGATYLRSLYLPLFARLPMPVEVVQVMYGDPGEVEATRAAAATLGVGYRGFAFSRRGRTGATLADGSRLLLREAARAAWGTRALVMARALVPAAALLAVRVPRHRFLFDADGLVADERVDFAGWSPTGWPYRTARAIERAALRRAAVTLTRTRAAAAILAERAGPGVPAPLVAPNGSDETRFVPWPAERRAAEKARLGLGPEDLLVVYCGTIGPQYRPDLMVAYVRALRETRPGRRVHLRVLTGTSDAARHFASLGSDVEVARVPPAEVPDRLAPADLALAFREPSFSQRAVCPIKVGEYLLCGVPVVANDGVGDLDAVLEPRFAARVARLGPEEVARLAGEVQVAALDREAARAAGVRHFGLDTAAAGYAEAVRRAGQLPPRV